MFGWIGGEYRVRAWSIGGVAIAHTALLAWVLTLPIAPAKVAAPEPVMVSFAEIADRPPMIETAEDRDVIGETEATAPLDAAETETQPPAPRPPSSPTPSEPAVLTQLESPERSSDAVGAASTNSEPVSSVDPQVVRTVLQTMSCQRLTMRRDEACPQSDPFAIAAASEARQNAPPASPLLIGNYGPKNALERFASQKDRDPYLMPGMSADLFSDGLPTGSYNAQRIRNGQMPLWSKEIERGFTRDD